MRIERGPDPGPLANAAQYKPHLRPLFRRRCAYCRTPDDRLGGEDGMTVDHFKSEKWYPQLRTEWSNLYYACPICNSHYKKDHPKPEEEAEGKRFVDPCREDPDDHFRLVCDPETSDLCRVRPLSPAAHYTVFRLNFNRRKSLRDFWRSLHHEETRLNARKDDLRQRLKDCLQLIDRYGPSEELERLRSDYEKQLTEARTELDATRQLRPFPVAI
jgi:uncharacterized protein (TIGR02646 family)